jgi:hypothetical protein
MQLEDLPGNGQRFERIENIRKDASLASCIARFFEHAAGGKPDLHPL